jgi:hypothetical protein
MALYTLKDYLKKESNCQKTDENILPTPNYGCLGSEILIGQFVLLIFLFSVGSKC